MIMKRLSLFLLSALLVLAAFAAERTVHIKGLISGISVSSGIDVLYVPGEAPGHVLVSGPADEIPLVDIKVKKSTIVIGAVEQRVWSKLLNRPGVKHVKVTVYAPAVGNISVSSGAEIKVRNPLALGGRNVKLSASSGGDIELDGGMVCGNCSANASSSGDIEVKGFEAKNLSMNASSGADIEFKAINVRTVKANVSSGANITVKGRADRADMNASSGGDIKIRELVCGMVRENRSSGGKIKR